MNTEDGNKMPSHESRVSVITVYYNRAQYVVTSIESLLAQTYPNMEIIAIDDGSTDSTFAILQSLSDPRLRVTRQENTGFVVALQRAIASATGDLIAIHGSGDISLPHRIARQVGTMQHRPSTVLVSSHVDLVDEVLGERFVKAPPAGRVELRTLLQSNPLEHGAMLFRRDAYDAVGGYRSVFTYAQNHDLALRMSLVGEIAIIPEVLYRAYRRPDGVTRSLEKVLIQRHLSHFARDCFHERMRYGTDAVDRYGSNGLFLRRRSKGLAIDLWRVGMNAMLAGDLEDAAVANRCSRDEQPLLRNVTYEVIRPVIKSVPSVRRMLALIYGRYVRYRTRDRIYSPLGLASGVKTSAKGAHPQRK
jgi:glycosyltransferase involved in cell wall biosynthesis